MFAFLLLSALVLSLPPLPRSRATERPIDLWPGQAPGERGDIGEERDTSPNPHEKGHVITLGNVSHPTITIYRPAKNRTRTCVLVCPGGGYQILAMNLEGTEICQWFNSLGVTAILLKYRVPSRNGLEKYTASLQDAQRAMGIVRNRAKELDIDPERIGIMGFSAGGHLSAALSNNFADRTYPIVDEADRVSCRPDFTMLIYPAYLTEHEDLVHLAPELRVNSNTPPTFIVMTEDDPIHVENALIYGEALKNVNVPIEMHIYSKGGHGYGLRPSPNPVSGWPKLAELWLESKGLLKR